MAVYRKAPKTTVASAAVETEERVAPSYCDPSTNGCNIDEIYHERTISRFRQKHNSHWSVQIDLFFRAKNQLL